MNQLNIQNFNSARTVSRNKRYSFSPLLEYSFVRNDSVNLFDYLGLLYGTPLPPPPVTPTFVYGRPTYGVSQNAMCCVETKDRWHAQNYRSHADCESACASEFYATLTGTGAGVAALCAMAPNPVVAAACAWGGAYLGLYALVIAESGCPLACEENICVKVASPKVYFDVKGIFNKRCIKGYYCPKVTHLTGTN